jgi:OOP family OmpA-OmpF porin
MNFYKISTILLLLGSLGYAGGDISPVSDYEVEDTVMADESAYTPPISAQEEGAVQEVQEPVLEDEEIEEDTPVLTPPPPPIKKKEPIKAPPIMVAPKPPKVRITPNGFYAGIGITGARYKKDCYCGSGIKKKYTDKTSGLMARAGYDFNQYVGIEVRGSRTNWKRDGSKIKHAGVYLKPMLPISNKSNIYGLVGVSKTKIKGSLPHLDNKGLSVGGGIEVDLSKDTPKDGIYSRKFDGQGDQEKGVGLFIDYERMTTKKHSPIVDAISAGVTYDF